MSRPQKTADNRRSYQVIFRLNRREHDLLHHKAELAGLSPNGLARRFTCNGSKTLVIRTSQRCDPAFLKRLDQIGHNLNQLVKNAHIFGRVSPQVDLLCGKINRVIDDALKEDDNDT